MERASFATNKEDFINLIPPNIMVQPRVEKKEETIIQQKNGEGDKKFEENTYKYNRRV